MNEQDFDKWGRDVKKVFYAQILLDRLKENKKINRKQEKEIKQKIKKLRYATHLKSPCFEGKENLRRRAAAACIRDYCSFMGFRVDTTFS